MSKHVMITGGTRGLGLATVVALLEAGYSVSSFSRTRSAELDELISQNEGRIFFKQADLSIKADLKAFVKEASATLGSPYAIINNSAVAIDGVLATLPEVDIERVVSTNLTGSILLTRLCVREMLKKETPGRVINISSIVGIRGFSGLSVYAATKAGLDGFTRGLARELGRRAITVNSVQPGYMRTAMSSSLEVERLDQIVRRTPLRRLAEPDDVVPLILFLLGDGAKFITGQCIVVDGGSTT